MVPLPCWSFLRENSVIEGEVLIFPRLLVFPPDISLPEAGPAVLHVPLVVVHSHGGVVRIVAPERICLTRALVVKHLLGRPSWIALFQALPASVGMQAIPVMRAKEGMISHHILINRRHSETIESFTQYHCLVQLELSNHGYSTHHELQCLKPSVDILDHMRGCHWVAHHRMLCGNALLR